MADSVAIINPGGGTGGGNPPNCVVGTGTDGVTGSTPRIALVSCYQNLTASPVALSSYATLAMWVRVAGGGNLVSDSLGALHVWLLQAALASVSSGQVWRPQGNVTLLDGTSSATLTPPVFPARVGMWHFVHVTFGLDGGGSFIYRFWVDGQCFYRTKLANVGAGTCGRAIPIAGTGLFGLGLFGIDHQGGIGRVAQWGVYENGQPFAASALSNNTPMCLVPPRVLPSLWGGMEATMLQSFDHDAAIFPDLSSGWTRTNSGTRYFAHPGVRDNPVAGRPGPTLVYDAFCPVGRFGDLTTADVCDPSDGNPSWHPTDRGSPGGANLLAFDLFRRPADGSQGSIGQQTYALQALSGPNLGWCDPRSPYANAQPWTEATLSGVGYTPGRGWISGKTATLHYGYDPSVGGFGECGIVKFGDNQTTTSWTQNVGTANHFSYVGRVGSSNDDRTCGVARYVDNANFIQVVAASSDTIFLIDYQAGSNATGFGWIATPSNLAWRKIGIWANGTNVRVYVDNPGGVTLTGVPGKWEQLTFGGMGNTYTDSTHGAGTRCGFGSPISTLQDPINAVIDWAAYST